MRERPKTTPGHPLKPPLPWGGYGGVPHFFFTLNFPLPGEPDKYIIEDMWLGVTVASQRQPAGRVLVSAPHSPPPKKKK